MQRGVKGVMEDDRENRYVRKMGGKRQRNVEESTWKV